MDLFLLILILIYPLGSSSSLSIVSTLLLPISSWSWYSSFLGGARELVARIKSGLLL